jgi:hypothetical protein
MIGGRFNQSDSVVAGNQINVGYIGPGTYNFNSGYFTVSQLWLGGGNSAGTFNQNGGTNGFGITHLDGGTYVLSNGWYGATIYFDNFGEFRQQGGVLASDLTMFQGTYVLAGGLHQGSVTVPSPNGFTEGSAGMLQTGGTNNGSLNIGSYGHGSCDMSNGISFAGSMTIGHGGVYHQSGGTQIIAGALSIDEQQVNPMAYEGVSLILDGGQISSSSLYSKGFYTQNGGTNFISGDVTIVGSANTTLSVSDGLLAVNNLTVSPAFVGGVSMTGGTLVITNTFSLGGNSSFPQWHGFVGGGQLVAADISLTPQALFSCGNGIITQSGTLTLASASLFAGSNSMQFGRLCLSSDGGTNSILSLPDAASVVHFADSSAVAWSNAVNLIVDHWSGAYFGGARQQINFGNDAGALADGQLGQIQFRNPAGVPAGIYTARMLATGELVPKAEGAPPALVLARQPAGMQVRLQGEVGSTYSIETSTDMVHWVPWTNAVAADGTITVTDTAATNYPARFYRARLVP